ncbi:metal ABC transporter substrate-binding protein [Vagococcus entomophilus]|uniref:Zinc ABC transporter substrate-binding protein n=1 Tax=Vagococcus entomophilus TaxID=1160095 RepID=A0A430AK68_9ENTE|nr:metal ABC transporter substrate-binding protein [Vagococcus entomophilus]RSU08500.1 zinc ABC transporter substrate-binding protein [Vagococcus entomophilus]
MKSKKWLGIILSVVFLLTLGACSQKETTSNDSKKLKVVTTFYPMYDFTKNVAGNTANISMLIGANTEPHDYEPSAKDIAKIQDADVFIYNSDEMETWVPSVLKQIDTKKTTVIEASKGITLMEGSEEEEEGHSHEGHSHAYDPHVWLDPVLAKQEVATIEKGFVKANNDQKKTYEKNADAYTKKLEALHTKYETALKDATNRNFVTQHTAFAYLAKRYNLNQMAISGLSPDQEPSAASLAKIEDYVKKNNVKIIFTEELASKKVAETVSSATGASLEVLSPIEGITEKNQAKGLDYIGVMEQNLTALQKVVK